MIELDGAQHLSDPEAQPRLILPGTFGLCLKPAMLYIVRSIRAISSIMSTPISQESVDQVLSLLSGRLDLAQTEPVRLVICGGAALIAMGIRRRTTRDMDIVALLTDADEPVSPDPLPNFLVEAADQVARDLGLFEGWLNNGPSRGEGGLFQMGLPQGFVGRLTEKKYGPRLSVFFIGRLDQVHFKLYAAADQRDGTHLNDLEALHPTATELETAAHWAMTHDVSEGFRMVLKELLTQIGHEAVAARV